MLRSLGGSPRGFAQTCLQPWMQDPTAATWRQIVAAAEQSARSTWIGSSKSLIQLGCFAQVATAHTASFGRVAANSLNTTRRSVSHLTEAGSCVNATRESRHKLPDPLAFWSCAACLTPI